MDAAAVEVHMRRVVAQWKGAPAVRVVARASDLPGGAPENVRARYFTRSREVALVADTHLRQAVERTMAHEVVAHDGLRQLLGREAWTSFMAAVAAGADGRDERLEAARYAVRAIYGDAAPNRLIEADETCAALAEAMIACRQGQMRPRSPWVSWWRAATGHLSREVLLLDRPATTEEIEAMLSAAEHRLRHGGVLWGIARKWYGSAMTKPMGPARPARDLQESEFMLREEQRRRDYMDGWKLFFQGTLAMILCVGSTALLGYGLLQIFGVIR